jgi:hypothetical protein
MIFGRPGRRQNGSTGRAAAESRQTSNPQECLRCSSLTSSHAWFVIAPPRTDPEPGLYCQNCAEAVGIVDEILQRFGDTEIEIPPEAASEQEYRLAGGDEDARGASALILATRSPARWSRILRLATGSRLSLSPELDS